MALQTTEKREARQNIVAAVEAASKKLGEQLSLKVINYASKGDAIVATMKIAHGSEHVYVNHVFATKDMSTTSAITASITEAFHRTPILAADDEEGDIMTAEEDDSDMSGMTDMTDASMSDSGDMQDAVDDLTDAVNDIQDDLEDIQEDNPNIQTENNIESHLIAECDACSGIFISAMIKSDQKVDSVKGVCPLCGKESTQHFKWFISKLEYSDGTAFNG